MMLRKLRPASLLRRLVSADHITLQRQTAALKTIAITSSQQYDSYKNSSFNWSLLAAFGLIGSATLSVAHSEGVEPGHPTASKGFNFLGMEQRRRAFFKYEKRIRELSPPEKVFEYFASQGTLQTGFFMTPGDMMRSVVPVYPPAGSEILRAGSLPGEPEPNIPDNDMNASEFMKAFDVDNSGGITFDEWLVFQSLLSIPDDDVEVAFLLVDTDGSGKISKQEFSNLLSSIQTRAAKPTASIRKSAGNLKEADSGLVALFFGKNGKGELSLEQFKAFIRQLRDELVKLEFQFYDYNKNGAINGMNFAHMIVGCARLKHADMYLEKIDAMPESLAKSCISYAEFVAFRQVWRRLRQLAVALEFHQSSSGKVTPEDLKTISDRVLGVKLPKSQLDVLFYLFGKQDGSLNIDYMYTVMDRHFETGFAVNYEHKKHEETSFLTCMQKCAMATNQVSL